LLRLGGGDDPGVEGEQTGQRFAKAFPQPKCARELTSRKRSDGRRQFDDVPRAEVRDERGERTRTRLR